MAAYNQLFEGPEKKLEIILLSPQPGLRSNIDNRWNRVVQSSLSKIVNKISNEHLDAYLLSESSLFVWEDRILMITCGQTTLVKALSEILDFVDKRNVAQVFYEQKNFILPHEQPSGFEDDLKSLMEYFPGENYRCGPTGGDRVSIFSSSHAKSTRATDVTLQVLMHDLHPDRIEIFRSNIACAEENIEKLTGLDRLYPHMLKDRHVFSPPGYSINGIYKTDYFTIHVTPQPNGSCASFETNIIEKDYSGIIKATTSIFEPGRFSVVLTRSTDDFCRALHTSVANNLRGYQMTENILHEFKSGYAVTFLNYITGD